jgi:hypothetical protein
MPLARRVAPAGQAALLATAAAALGLAVHLRDGAYHPSALGLVGVALVCTLAVLLEVPLLRLSGRALVALLAALVLGQLAILFTQPVARSLPANLPDLWQLQACFGGVAAAVVAVAVGPPWLRRGALAVLLVLHVLAGVWILRHAAPETDVFNFQRGSLEALRRGIDPYAIKFRNIYHPNTSFYGPGLVVNGILQFGYPYPPLPLYLTWAALPAGDIRYAHLAALTLGGAAIACARPGRVAPLAAALLLFSPRFGLLLQMSWTEPFTILFLGTTILCALRAPRLLPLSLGFLLASKQYLVVAAPAVLLLVPEPRPRRALVLLAQAVGVALALTLPLALWNLGAFVRSAVTLQFHQPFRPDAISVLVPLVRAGLPRALGGVLPLLFAPLALLLALRRCPRTPAGFALAVGFVYLVFFAFNKQAFCNYYFLPLAALCAAIAAAPEESGLGVADHAGREAGELQAGPAGGAAAVVAAVPVLEGGPLGRV